MVLDPCPCLGSIVVCVVQYLVTLNPLPLNGALAWIPAVLCELGKVTKHHKGHIFNCMVLASERGDTIT